MKILYIDYSIGFGGSFKSLSLTFSALPDVEKFLITSQDEHLVREWYPNIPVWGFRKWINYRLKARLEDRYRGNALRWPVMKLFVLADWISQRYNAIKISRLIRSLGVDVVHLNNAFTPDAILAAHWARVPSVVHLRGFMTEQSTLELGPSPQVAAVIAVSDAVAASIDARKIPRERIVTVYDPVDIKATDDAAGARSHIRAQCGLASEHVAMGIFGRVVEWKGQLEFVHAAIHAMHHNAAIRAVIIGDESDGGPAYFNRVRSAIQNSGLADRFVLVGYRSNVEEFYAAMDIVVHASITPEPFGMVIPEGMAAGKPVIATNAGGPGEVIEDGITGLLVPLGDVDALCDAMLRLAENPEMRREMGEAARQVALRDYSIPVQARKVASIYNVVLREPQLASVAHATTPCD
jgi:glycosyltransferase involved in cell wall biosynthesis